MKRLLLPLSLFALTFTPCSAATPEGQGQWVQLFDGKSTKRMDPAGKVENFSAEDGELKLFSKVNVWVISDLQLADFEVEAEVKYQPTIRVLILDWDSA